MTYVRISILRPRLSPITTTAVIYIKAVANPCLTNHMESISLLLLLLCKTQKEYKNTQIISYVYVKLVSWEKIQG